MYLKGSKRVRCMKKDRLANVDIIRIIAIFLVIGCHIILPPINRDGTVDIYRTCVAAFVGGGVGLFWIVSGFFAFNDRKYVDKVKHLAKSILLPAIVLIIFSQIFFNYIESTAGILDCIKNISFKTFNFRSVLTGIINRNSSLIPLGEHLWYIFTYVENFLWIPLLTIFFKSKDNKTAKGIIYVFGITAMLISSIEKFYTFKIGSVNTFNLLPISLMYMMIGYELFSKKEVILNNKKIRWISFAIYIMSLSLKMWFQVLTYNNNVADVFFLSWTCLPSLIENISLILFVLSFNIKSNNVMSYLGKNVFGIYLVHWMIKEKIVSSGRNLKLFELLNCESKSLISTINYTLVMTLVIFICSIIIIYLIDLFIKGIKYFYKKVKK